MKKLLMDKPPYQYLAGYIHKAQPLISSPSVFRSAVILLACLLGALIICLFSSCDHITVPARASEVNHSNEQIVNAIWKIEGGNKAQYAYGIRSVRYSSLAEARHICYNTVRKNRIRFTKQNKYTDYLDFLASRYCPTSGKLSNTEQRLNKYWIGNLRKQLARGK